MKRQLLLLLFVTTWLAGDAQSLFFPAGSSGSRVDIGDLDVEGKAITIEALATIGPGDTNLMDIVSKHYTEDELNYLFRSSQFTIMTNRGTAMLKNPAIFCSNTTYHLAATYDGEMMKYYVNGVLVASMPWTGYLSVNNETAAIGNIVHWGKAANEQFFGYLDEVRIWNVARTQQQIQAFMYKLDDPGKQPGLLAYYKFDGSYKNRQGDTRWDGRPQGQGTGMAANPFFTGKPDNTFCGQWKLLGADRAAPPASSGLPPAATVSKPAASQPVSTKPVTGKYTTVRVGAWDFDGADQDSISLKLNGQPVTAGIVGLASVKKSGEPAFSTLLELIKGDNILEVKALNEGLRAFNTVALLVIDQNGSRRYYYRLKTGESRLIHLEGK